MITLEVLTKKRNGCSPQALPEPLNLVNKRKYNARSTKTNMAAKASIYTIIRNSEFFKPLNFNKSSLPYFYCALRQSYFPVNASLFPKAVQRAFNNHQFFLDNVQITGGGLNAEMT
ncbi:MAG: hypothetical protein WKF91_15420 [Segetibacter sp.]